MSSSEVAVIRPKVHPDLAISVHVIEEGRFVYDEAHPVDDEGHFPQPRRGNGLLWIHIPTNNMEHVASCFAKCENPEVTLNPSFWTMKMRPALSKTLHTPSHAIHMEASCIERESRRSASTPEGVNVQARDARDPPHPVSGLNPDWLPLLSVYLPYMSWMVFEDYLRRASIGNREWPGSQGSFASSSDTFCHPRRTLDQFYYPALDDTSIRDADQTVSKWSGRNVDKDGKPKATPDSLLVMVDQLWCWVVDEDTVISSFPSTYTSDDLEGFTGLYECVRERATTCETVWDLHSLLVKEATGLLFNQQNKAFRDMIETYRWVTNRKAAYQTTYFQDFHEGYATGESSSKVYDGRNELKGVLEVADIIDELKMIRHLLQTQLDTLKPMVSALTRLNPSSGKNTQQQTNTMNFHAERVQGNITVVNSAGGILNTEQLETTNVVAQGINGQAKENVLLTDKTLLAVFVGLEGISKEAEHTHRLLLNLLDLKSKTAMLVEARSSTKQGQAVMLFTIVTVIFLPLSFFTSYFGQNVSEITGDTRNPTTWGLWRIATPIIVVVVLLSLLIAYYITEPKSSLWFWKSLRVRFRKWLHGKKRPDPEKNK